MYMAKWGPKGFLVSPEKIVTFDGFSTSIALKSDSTNDTSGTAPTNTKGREPQTVSMSINYVRAAGVDPRGQFDEWSSLVGQAYPLYIGDDPFGPEFLMLTKVDLSDLQLAPDGKFISAKIAVSFDEYTPPKPVVTAVVVSKNTAASGPVTPAMEKAMLLKAAPFSVRVGKETSYVSQYEQGGGINDGAIQATKYDISRSTPPKKANNDWNTHQINYVPGGS
jgi:hypothetical protein